MISADWSEQSSDKSAGLPLSAVYLPNSAKSLRNLFGWIIHGQIPSRLVVCCEQGFDRDSRLCFGYLNTHNCRPIGPCFCLLLVIYTLTGMHPFPWDASWKKNAAAFALYAATARRFSAVLYAGWVSRAVRTNHGAEKTTWDAVNRGQQLCINIKEDLLFARDWGSTRFFHRPKGLSIIEKWLLLAADKFRINSDRLKSLSSSMQLYGTRSFCCNELQGPNSVPMNRRVIEELIIGNNGCSKNKERYVFCVMVAEFSEKPK